VLKTTSEVPPSAVGIHGGVNIEDLHESFAKMYSEIGFIADPDG